MQALETMTKRDLILLNVATNNFRATLEAARNPDQYSGVSAATWLRDALEVLRSAPIFHRCPVAYVEALTNEYQAACVAVL